jgi:hypothetical protein
MTKKQIYTVAIIIFLIFSNPSESSFHNYARAHSIGYKTAKEINLLVLSIFYADGIYGSSYYLGIAGTYFCINHTKPPEKEVAPKINQ